MSRSYKKHGWVKDGARRSNSSTHYEKKKANKAVRRFTEDIPTKSKFFRKITNSWDIHDFIVEAREYGSEPGSYRDWMK